MSQKMKNYLYLIYHLHDNPTYVTIGPLLMTLHHMLFLRLAILFCVILG